MEQILRLQFGITPNPLKRQLRDARILQVEASRILGIPEDARFRSLNGFKPLSATTEKNLRKLIRAVKAQRGAKK